VNPTKSDSAQSHTGTAVDRLRTSAINSEVGSDREVSQSFLMQARKPFDAVLPAAQETDASQLTQID